MIMEALNAILGIATVVNTISEGLDHNDNRSRVEVIDKEAVREVYQQPYQQSPINLTINVNVYKDGKKSSMSSRDINDESTPLSITQKGESIDLDLN